MLNNVLKNNIFFFGFIFLKLFYESPNPVLGKAQYVIFYLSPFFRQAHRKACKKCHSFVGSAIIFHHDLRGKLEMTGSESELWS